MPDLNVPILPAQGSQMTAHGNAMTPAMTPAQGNSSGPAPGPTPWVQKNFVLDNTKEDGGLGHVTTASSRSPTLYLATLRHILSVGTADDIALALEFAPPTGGIDRPAFRQLVFSALGQRRDAASVDCLQAALAPFTFTASQLLDEAIELKDASYALAAMRMQPQCVSPRQFELLCRFLPHVALLALEANQNLYHHLGVADLDRLLERLARSLDRSAAVPDAATTAICDDLIRTMPHGADWFATKARLPGVYRAVLDRGPARHSDRFWNAVVEDTPEQLPTWFALRPDWVDGTALSEMVDADTDLANQALLAALDANPGAVNTLDHVHLCPIDAAVIRRNRVAFDILKDRGGDVEGIDGRISTVYAGFGYFADEMRGRLASWQAE